MNRANAARLIEEGAAVMTHSFSSTVLEALREASHGGKKFSREELERMPMMVWEIEIEEMTGREGVW